MMNRARLWRLGWIAACVATVASGGCAARSESGVRPGAVDYDAVDWTFGGREGRQLSTAHYEIYTTVKDEVLQNALPQALEAAYAHFRELLPAAGAPQAPMQVYLFARRAEFEAFTRQYGGARADALLQVRFGGYSERGVSVIEFVANQVTFPVMVHEALHQFLYACAHPNVPAWLNEGLAVQVEGYRWGRDGISAFDPWFNPKRRNDLLEALQRGDAFPLRELLRINAGHVVGGSSRKIKAYYAQLWALTLFLSQSDYADEYVRLLGALGREDLEAHAQAALVSAEDGVSYNFGEGLFRAFITQDLAAFEEQWDVFIQEDVLMRR